MGSSNDNQKQTHRRILVGAAVGMAAALVFALQAKDAATFLSVVSTAVLVAAAATAAGAFFGFLFGIPRALQSDTAPAPDATDEPTGEKKPGYAANTNLEQISDWLTKILVGVGLTQIGAIPGGVAKYADATAPALGGFSGSAVFSVALLIYFVIVGFLTGYLLTRLYLGPALRRADLASIGELKARLDHVERQAESDRQAVAAARRQLGGVGGETITQGELDAALKAASREVRTQVFYDAVNARRTNADAGKRDAIERTIPIFRALIACDEKNVYHRTHAQLAYALKDQPSPDLTEAIDELTTAIEMRGDPAKAGFRIYELNRAKCRIRLAKQSDDDLTEDPGRTAVLADLQVASGSNPLASRMVGDELVTEWLAANGLTLQDLRADAQPAASAPAPATASPEASSQPTPSDGPAPSP